MYIISELWFTSQYTLKHYTIRLFCCILINMRNWRNLTIIWTVLMYVVVMWDFYLDNGASDVLFPLLAIYISILSIYVAEKEFERWHRNHTSNHNGEANIIFFTILIAFMVITDAIVLKDYTLEPSLIFTYVFTIGLFALTQTSKKLYKSLDQNKIPTD
jgi:hypothetical protein